MVGVIGQGIRVISQQLPDLLLRKDDFSLIELIVAVAEGIGLRAVVIHDDIAGGKVDFNRSGVVNTAQITNQRAVDKNPDVVIAGEIVCNLLGLGLILRRILRRMSPILLDEAGAHAQTKVVVDLCIG